MRRAARCLGIAVALAGVAPAYADVSFHGFGQIAVGSSLSNDRSFDEPQNYQADPSFQNESLFALQVQAPLSDRFSATAQIVASGQNNNDFTPKFEWAYVSYRISDAWSIKGGRQRTPLYRYSDYLQVGQAYPWIRPPLSVYQGFVTNFDGLSLNGYYEFGDFIFQPQFSYGDVKKSFSAQGQDTSIEEHNVTGLVLDLGYRDLLTFRASWFYGQLAQFSNSRIDPLFDNLNAPFLAPGVPNPGYNPAAVEGMSATGDSVIFYSGGVQFTPGKFFFDGEYVGLRLNDSLYPRQNEYYASAGYHFGKFTPFLTYGHVDQAASNPGAVGQVTPGSQCVVGVNPLTGLPVLAPCVAVVQGVINSVRDLRDYYEVGFRYDVTRSTALKLDFTRELSHNPPGFGVEAHHSVNLLSAAFVFVF